MDDLTMLTFLAQSAQLGGATHDEAWEIAAAEAALIVDRADAGRWRAHLVRAERLGANVGHPSPQVAVPNVPA